MRTKCVHLVLAITLASAVVSCRTDEASAPSPASPPATIDLSLRPTPSPSAGPLSPDDPNNPLLIGYCSAQDRVVTLEGQLLSRHLSLRSSLAKMSEAQRAARSAEKIFRRAGEQHLALLVSRWAESFDKVRAGLARGERPFDALRPAIVALTNIEEVFTCELDG